MATCLRFPCERGNPPWQATSVSAPPIDIGLELIGIGGDDIERLVCEMANLMHERRRFGDSDHLEPINWGDADMWVARVQELINAATLSHREERWVYLPLDA